MPTLRVPVKNSSSSFSDDHSSEIFKVTMRYFHLFRRKKSEERKARNSVSDGSNSSAYMSMSTDHDTRRSGSEINSQNVSDFRTANEFFEEDSAMSHWDSNLREFKLSELKKATNNFSPSLIIGEGGFGCVYRGEIGSSEDPNKKIDVAVKQLGRRGLRGHKEWLTEISVLGVVEHQNLVKLVGYCAEDDERGIHRLLVYEYMPNRSVSDHLSSRCHTPLPWCRRIRIAQDAARGLAYLHEGMDFQIIFRDFKSSNILLDDQWNAKLSDFGLARLGPAEGLSHVTTAVVGTVGYAAPEYIHTGRLTSKSDVWAYGVFLYELITGRRPLDRNRPKNQQKLLDWVWAHLSDPRRFRVIMDPRLEGKYNIKSAQKLAAVANWCLALEAKARPKMSEVLEMVTKIVDGTETESPQLPVKSLAPKDAPETCIKERLKRFVNPISRENGCLAWRTSSQKLVR